MHLLNSECRESETLGALHARLGRGTYLTAMEDLAPNVQKESKEDIFLQKRSRTIIHE